MSYNAKVYKVFVASPSDVVKEREIICKVINRWNLVHSERLNKILLPVTWEDGSASDSGRSAQDYLNEELLDNCDILIGVFWSRVGTKTRNFDGGAVEEVTRNLSNGKLTMVYFSNKKMPADVDIEQLQKLRKFKDDLKISKVVYYSEYEDYSDFESKLYRQIELKMQEGRFRSTWDSDWISRINNDNEMAEKINAHFPLVARNVLKNIINQRHEDVVWESIANKLAKSPADLRESLVFMAKRGAFKNLAYIKGAVILSEKSQHDFGNFMSELFLINRTEFYYLLEQGLLLDSKFKEDLLKEVKEAESEENNLGFFP